MKSVVILGDGMADYAVPELGGLTPLEAARHPSMDLIAHHGIFGMARTVPEGMAPGSDTANLSVFGYDPAIYHTGRSPLEAASIGIDLAPNDVTYRCNLVTLPGLPDDEKTIMTDYSGGEITTEEADVLIKYLSEHLGTEGIEFHTGTSYRHCLVLRNALTGGDQIPPHDISGQRTSVYLPKGQNSDLLLDLMLRSYKLLRDHPINKSRIERGLNPANCAWFWGEGRKPSLTPFAERFGVKRSAVISAVDLIQGIGICAGMDVIKVPGITGTYHTDFASKSRAAIDALKNGYDLIYIHIEAPDECGHHYEIKEKAWSIEQIDEKVAAPILKYLRECGEDWSVLVMPDHPTPLSIMTHTGEPVPFALVRSFDMQDNGEVRFTENEARKTGLYIDKACRLMDILVGRK